VSTAGMCGWSGPGRSRQDTLTCTDWWRDLGGWRTSRLDSGFLMGRSIQSSSGRISDRCWLSPRRNSRLDSRSGTRYCQRMVGLNGVGERSGILVIIVETDNSSVN